MTDKEKEEIISKIYKKNERYTIVPCGKWEDMIPFRKPITNWYAAQKGNGKYDYDMYTNNGMDMFYVCLRDDYKTVEEKHITNSPLDEYGLSMIAVCVNTDGSLKTCTCRWNDENGGHDHIMDEQQLSDLLGVNFFEVFKPRSPEDIFNNLEYIDNPICSKLGFKFNKRNRHYYRLKDNKLLKYTECFNNYAGIVCLANTRLEWYDLETGKEIEPPEQVYGNFSCFDCEDLITLKGSPKKVGENFSCYNCKNLTSLEGAPSIVDGDFDCRWCNNLTSLKGSPSEVGGNFDCSYCYNLTSLEGGPSKVGWDFHCFSCLNLVSLKGAPSKVFGDFYCFGCKKLTLLKYSPSYVDGDFRCSTCHHLTSLEYAPLVVGGSFDCSGCINLTSLEGAPKKVGGDFNCAYCSNLESLKGAPVKVLGKFTCEYCSKLTSVDEAPESIRNKIDH